MTEKNILIFTPCPHSIQEEMSDQENEVIETETVSDKLDNAKTAKVDAGQIEVAYEDLGKETLERVAALQKGQIKFVCVKVEKIDLADTNKVSETIQSNNPLEKNSIPMQKKLTSTKMVTNIRTEQKTTTKIPVIKGNIANKQSTNETVKPNKTQVPSNIAKNIQTIQSDASGKQLPQSKMTYQGKDMCLHCKNVICPDHEQHMKQCEEINICLSQGQLWLNSLKAEFNQYLENESAIKLSENDGKSYYQCTLCNKEFSNYFVHTQGAYHKQFMQEKVTVPQDDTPQNMETTSETTRKRNNSDNLDYEPAFKRYDIKGYEEVKQSKAETSKPSDRSPIKCRFGKKCVRPNCWYLHDDLPATATSSKVEGNVSQNLSSQNFEKIISEEFNMCMKKGLLKPLHSNNGYMCLLCDEVTSSLFDHITKSYHRELLRETSQSVLSNKGDARTLINERKLDKEDAKPLWNSTKLEKDIQPMAMIIPKGVPKVNTDKKGNVIENPNVAPLGPRKPKAFGQIKLEKDMMIPKGVPKGVPMANTDKKGNFIKNPNVAPLGPKKPKGFGQRKLEKDMIIPKGVPKGVPMANTDKKGNVTENPNVAPLGPRKPSTLGGKKLIPDFR